MSLMVYDRWQLLDGQIPVSYVENTTDYFDNNITLPDTSEVRNILRDIDDAGYLDCGRFQGNKNPVGVAHINCLSSGCKAVLCVALCPTMCFGHLCCGPNATFRILQLRHGNFLYTGDQYPFKRSLECDIVYRDRKFSDIVSFLKWRSANGFSK